MYCKNCGKKLTGKPSVCPHCGAELRQTRAGGKKAGFWGSASVFLRAFLILAVLFLAVGLGTLGSVHSTGKAFELATQQAGDNKEPCLIIEVSEPGHGEEEHVHRNLYVKQVYINVGTIYGEIGKSAKIRLGRGTTATAGFGSYVELSVANVYETLTTEAKEGEEAETTRTRKDDLFNWLAFDVPAGGWNATTYNFYRLTTLNYNVLVNEIVFVANEEDDSGEPVILKGTVSSSSELAYNSANKETKQDVIARAQEALFDAQRIPACSERTNDEGVRTLTPVQSSFFRFGGEEFYSLMTLSEMRMGKTYTEGNVYHIDNVSNSLGIDMLALGTSIFGMSPFGLRVIPMLCAFGALLFGFFFVRKLTGSEKAAFVFSLLFVLCGISMSVAHFGTTAMIGLFFYLASLYFCSRFFMDGMKSAKFSSALPVVLSGLFAAAAICTDGAYLIPVLGVIGLFAAGVVRMKKADRARLEVALEEAEEEQKTAANLSETELPSEGKRKAEKIFNEGRNKRKISISLFAAFLVFGALLISMLAVLPVYFTFLKYYDDPVDPKLNIFYFILKAFAGGFAGNNEVYGGTAAAGFIRILYHGAGESYAVTATGILPAAAALLAGISGVVYLLVKLFRGFKGEKFSEAVQMIFTLTGGFVLSAVAGCFAGNALGFLLLCFLFLFALAGYAVQCGTDDKSGKVKAFSYVMLALLAICFVLFAVFTFSIPLSGGFLSKIF